MEKTKLNKDKFGVMILSDFPCRTLPYHIRDRTAFSSWKFYSSSLHSGAIGRERESKLIILVIQQPTLILLQLTLITFVMVLAWRSTYLAEKIMILVIGL